MCLPEQNVCKKKPLEIGVEEILKLDEMRVNPFAARICLLFSENGTGKLDFSKFVNVVSTFSSRTSADLKMVWIFALWDFDGDDILGPGINFRGNNNILPLIEHPAASKFHVSYGVPWGVILNCQNSSLNFVRAKLQIVEEIWKTYQFL